MDGQDPRPFGQGSAAWASLLPSLRVALPLVPRFKKRRSPSAPLTPVDSVLEGPAGQDGCVGRLSFGFGLKKPSVPFWPRLLSPADSSTGRVGILDGTQRKGSIIVLNQA